jgi:hypothetical protein
VAVAAAPARRRSLIGQVVAAWQARSPSRASRLAGFAARARQHVVTVAALTSVDLGAFHWGGGVGWVVTGVTLLAFDYAVTG